MPGEFEVDKPGGLSLVTRNPLARLISLVLVWGCAGTPESCPYIDLDAIEGVGCGWGFRAGQVAGTADRETCDFGRTPIPDIDEAERDLQSMADFCDALVGAGQTSGACVDNVRYAYGQCAPGGYSFGYFGEDGYCPSADDTAAR